ncbi:hypothetical protein [Klebsiella phage vB_KpnP_IME205]|jgi:hypothetical protein|uniref:Uncharacterized protein n=1 Tax=Klebsiella phage vB_KpnP_IME205 TaxID=1770232 RepID=A0A0U3CQF9_BPKIM|nr:hypothetical protein HOR12_gp20 [Klebsiella phage vB_KpnP_IME205]ALT58475.1 hypothetical protein [Klebsiella phage vB_KpnP_IME205]UVX31268.1 hypothetical protein A3d_00019 [Klebsiella phage VLCpiA3d]
MIKLIEALGRLVVSLYVREAKAFDAKAKSKAKDAGRLAAEADIAMKEARNNVTKAANAAAKAQKLKEFF